MTLQQVLLTIVLPIVAAPLIWCVVMLIIGFLTGWQSLAKIYPMTQSIPGEKRLYMQSMGISLISKYNNCLTVGFSDQGMSLSMPFVFRPGHSPIFIPWEDILAERFKAFKLIPSVRLILVKSPKFKLYLTQSQADKYAKHAGEYWPCDVSEI